MNSMNSTVIVHARHSQSLLRKDLPPLRGSCAASNASARRIAHILGALDLHSCRQIFMQDKKSPQECFLFTWKYDKMQGNNHYYTKLLSIDFAEYKEALKMCAFENT